MKQLEARVRALEARDQGVYAARIFSDALNACREDDWERIEQIKQEIADKVDDPLFALTLSLFQAMESDKEQSA